MTFERLTAYVCWVLAVITVGSPMLRAQERGAAISSASSASTATLDISGLWELSFDSRRIPEATLLPSITRAMRADRAKRDAYAIRWCNMLGMPWVMDSGRPLDIRHGRTAIVIVPEHSSGPRYLYLDRKTHIAEDIFDPTTYGDSIAHREGDTLVVDTIGFHPDRGITAIPGGGFRTATSRLVERYRLLEDGNVLSVVFTWSDPKVFRMPHTYEFRYNRMPDDYEPRLWAPCDPFNETRARFLEGLPAGAAAGNR